MWAEYDKLDGLFADETLHLEGCILRWDHEGDCFIDPFPCAHFATMLVFDDLIGEKYLRCLDCDEIIDRRQM